MRFSFSSLRVCLMLLVILSLLPAFVLILYTTSEDCRPKSAKGKVDPLYSSGRCYEARFEMGPGIYINVFFPEEIARFLREK